MKALLKANFQVTVLSRSSNTERFDPKVKVLKVDFESVESLTAALKGQNAVVSTINTAAVGEQKPLIDAAVAAGVSRFIPSEFGSVTTNPELSTYPVFSGLAGIREHLIEKSKTSPITYTVLACGAFLDLLFGNPGILDFDNHKATLFDEGNNRFSSTSIAKIAQSIVGILKHTGETANKVIHVSEVILTQNKVLEIAKQIQPEADWEVTAVPSDAVLQGALRDVAAGNFSEATIIAILSAVTFGGERYGAAYDKTDNELLGIETLSDEDLRKRIAIRLDPNGAKGETWKVGGKDAV